LSSDLIQWIAGGVIQVGEEMGVNSWTDDGLHALGPASAAIRRFYKVLQLE
jgi:hypothetical protein